MTTDCCKPDEIVGAALAAGRLEVTKLFEMPDGGHVLLKPAGFETVKIAPLSRKLERIEASVRLDEQGSFVEYVNRFKGPATTIFADAVTGPLSVKAVLDYHEPETPRYAHHIAVYAPVYAEEWRTWTAVKTMKQAEFAEFIEENRDDIRMPSAASLLEIVTKFRATKKQDYDSVVYQPDGSAMIAWSDKVEGAGKPGVPVPTELTLGIPVFFKGASYEVPVFLRYRIIEGVLLFTLKLDRVKLIEQHAIDKVVAEIAGATEVPMLYGAPLVR